MTWCRYILTKALDAGKISSSHSRCFAPSPLPSSHWTQDCVDTWVGTYVFRRNYLWSLPGIEPQNVPPLAVSLRWLSYPTSPDTCTTFRQFTSFTLSICLFAIAISLSVLFHSVTQPGTPTCPWWHWQKHNSIQLVWVAGHTGTDGNETDKTHRIHSQNPSLPMASLQSLSG